MKKEFITESDFEELEREAIDIRDIAPHHLKIRKNMQVWEIKHMLREASFTEKQIHALLQLVALIR